MKFVVITVLVSVLAFFQCGKDTKTLTNKKSNLSENKMSEVKNNKTIKAEFDLKVVKKGTVEDGITYAQDTIALEYSLKNESDVNYVIFNQGHFGGDKGKRVYISPLSSNGVELSQKAFIEPKDKTCPQRLVPIIPRGKLLKVNETLKDKVFVEMPLKLNTPFDDCSPQPEFPKKVEKVKFCIGFVESKSATVDEKGNVSDLSIIEKQKTICSKEFEVK